MKGPALGECLGGYLGRQVAEVRRLTDPGGNGSAPVLDPDGVHDLRVALRRIDAILTAGGPAYDKGAVRPLRRAARDLIRVLGQPRDLEVLTDLLLPRIGDPADRALVRTVLSGRHDRAEAAARSALSASALQALDRGLDHLLVLPPTTGRADRPARKEAPRLVRRQVRRVARLAEEAPRQPTDAERWEALHDVRKATKRARYLLEATKGVKPARSGAKVRELRTLQDVLGDQHDLVVAAGVIRELGAAEPKGSLVVLAAELEAEAESAEPAYLEAWGRVRERAGTAGWLG